MTSTSTAFGLEGLSSFTLSGSVLLSKTKISCTAASASGNIANPAGEAAGTFSTEAGSSLVLSGCTVVEGPGTGCQVEGGSIAFNALSGAGTEFEGGHAVKIGEEGLTLATFKIIKIEGKTCTSTPVTVKGIVNATVNPATSSLEFTEAGSKSLKMNAAKATMTGTALVRTAGAEEPLRMGTPPVVNTTKPSVWPSSPHVGTMLTASTGTWSGEPTSYAYQWQRCSAAGTECTNISGATKSQYTAVGAKRHRQADRTGHREQRRRIEFGVVQSKRDDRRLCGVLLVSVPESRPWSRHLQRRRLRQRRARSGI